MKTTLDNALTRWSVVCRVWEDFAAGSSPILGAFLAGWFTRDMGLPIPDDLPAVGCDSFRKAWQECDSFLIILNRQQQ